MAKLAKCKTCAGVVSSTADTCPHCGQKNPRFTGKSCLLVLLLGVLILLGISTCVAVITPNDEISETSTEPSNDTDTSSGKISEYSTGSHTKIKVSDYAYTFREKPAASISIVTTNTHWFNLTIIKSSIVEGFEARYDLDDNFEKDQFDIEAVTEEKGTHWSLPQYYPSNFEKVRIVRIDKNNKVATFEVGFELTHMKNHRDRVFANDLRFDVTGANFDLLFKQY